LSSGADPHADAGTADPRLVAKEAVFMTLKDAAREFENPV
jgi:hypothetical protein